MRRQTVPPRGETGTLKTTATQRVSTKMRMWTWCYVGTEKAPGNRLFFLEEELKI